jgi:hypothetical protein
MSDLIRRLGRGRICPSSRSAARRPLPLRRPSANETRRCVRPSRRDARGIRLHPKEWAPSGNEALTTPAATFP